MLLFFHVDFPCVKTNQCYHNNHYFSTSELLENSGNLSSLSNNYATRRSKRDKRKRISMQRQSFIEKTSTSRYRTFVEREIRDGGLIGLIKRLKIILSTTMWKARFTLAEMFGKERHSMLQHEGRATHFEEDLKRVIELLMKFSRTSEQDYTFFDAHIFICENKWAKAIQEMNLPSFLDNYLFLIRIPFDLTQESIRFRLDYKPKVEPSEHSIRQVCMHNCQCQCIFYVLWSKKRMPCSSRLVVPCNEILTESDSSTYKHLLLL